MNKEEKARRPVWVRVRILIPMSVMPFLAGCSSDAENSIYNFANVEPKNIDPWTYLQDTSITSSLQIRSLASSSYSLAITVGVMGVVFSILYMAIRILFTQNVKMKSEVKEEVFLKGFIAIVLFSIPLWLSIFKMIGELLI